MKKIIVYLVTSCTFNFSLNAQWSTDPAVNNQLCSNAPMIGQNIGNDHLIRVIHDGSGGAFICWFDFPNSGPLGGMDVQLQHISANGITWPGNGITVTNADYNQRFPEMALDGSGGVVLTWYTDADAKVYAQRVDANGNALWAVNGVAVCTGPAGQYFPNIIKNENGNVTIVWKDNRGISGFAVYAQQLNMSGNPVWDPTGVMICSGYVPVGGVRPIQIVSDGSNGVIATWPDTRAGLKPYLQRLLANGTVAWVPDGVPVCNYPTEANLISDGNAGAILCWADNRNDFTTRYDIFTQHIDQGGNLLWGIDGIPVCTAPETQTNTLIVTDGAGGAIISWNDFRDNIGNLIYWQRVNAAGIMQWATNGIEISDQAPYGAGMKMTADGTGGAIITWNNLTPADLRAQRINATGSILFPATGAIVCSRSTTSAPDITAVGSGNSILAWVDFRNPGLTGIFGSRLLANGTLPVTGLSFYGVKDQTSNKLYWTTASEQNNRGFDIERSSDGILFQSIGSVTGRGNSSSLESYTFIDRQPVSGKNYYRLKQSDLDNHFTYSKIILLQTINKSNLDIFPNPANTYITIQSSKPGTAQIIDVSGKIVMNLLLKGNSNIINISKLVPGIYYCRLDDSIIGFVKQAN